MKIRRIINEIRKENNSLGQPTLTLLNGTQNVQKLTVVHLVKEVYGHCGTGSFFYRVRTNPARDSFFIKLNPYTSKFGRTISLYLYVRRGLPIRIFPSNFPTKITHEFLILPAHVFDRSHQFYGNLKLRHHEVSSAPCAEVYF